MEDTVPQRVENYKKQYDKFMSDIDLSEVDEEGVFQKRIKVSPMLNPRAKTILTDRLKNVIKEIEEEGYHLDVPVAFTSKYSTKKKIEAMEGIQKDIDELLEKFKSNKHMKKELTVLSQDLMTQLDEELKRSDQPYLGVESNIPELVNAIPEAIKNIKELIEKQVGKNGDDPLSLGVKLDVDKKEVQEQLNEISKADDFSLTIGSLQFSDNMMNSIKSLDKLLEERQKKLEEAKKKGETLDPINIYEDLSPEESEDIQKH